VRTEELLSDTLQDLADQARTPEVTLARIAGRLPARASRHRRVPVPAVAAVVLIALAVAVTTFLVNRAVAPAGQRVKGNWNLIHRVELPPGWEVRNQAVTADSESSTVAERPSATGDVTSCRVEVFAAGRADPTAARDNRRPVTVNGRRGYWADDSSIETGGLSWEYRPGAFALVSCGGSQAEDLAIAERVRFEAVPVRLPFRLRSMPPGYEAATLAPALTSSEGTLLGGVQFRAKEDSTEPRSFSVLLRPGRTDPQPGVPGWESETIAGRPAVLYARDARLCLNLERHTACVEASPGDPEDLTRSLWAAGRRELLVDVAERLVLAEDLDDPATWWPANRALRS